MGEYYAHSKGADSDKCTWQPLEEHLKQTAELAKGFAAAWKAGDWGYFAGLWHDIGKYSNEFQQRLSAKGGENAHIENDPHLDLKSSEGGKTGKVNHSTAGARHANDVLKEKGFGKAMAYVIAGHHGGLPDGNSSDSCLRKRLDPRKDIPDYSGAPQEILDSRTLNLPFSIDKNRAGIQISIFIRMLYSALVDADFLDTERFHDERKAQQRQGYKSLDQLAPLFFQKLENMQKTAADSTVNLIRRQILEQCLAKANNGLGRFSLTVPTGGGKTLSSMAFALKHCLKHNLKRIIYVIPFTSIIEQNAEVLRSFLGKDVVLEHHCNFEPESEDYRSRLAAENWDAPIIVTTNVQFFESLFANRSSRCRKLHNIAESVVILDEVQTLPAPYLLPCLSVLEELVINYRTSVVLCSATQPAVQKRPDFPNGLEEVTEIMDAPEELARSMKRTDIVVLEKMSNEDVCEKLKTHRQVLCVVSTRRLAKDIFEKLQGLDGLFHLSALMCPAHRTLKLDEIRNRLKAKYPCRVISTQLIEAGVDIDFPVVFRSIDGIDSIAQAAGRCNREGKLDKGQVFVFTPEGSIAPRHFRQTTQAAESVIRRYSDDILSLGAIEEYFKFYYWTKGEMLDKEEILLLLREGLKHGDFPFKTIAERFRFIKEYMKPVVIPFNDDARNLIRSIEYLENPAVLSRKLQKYTVSILPSQWDNLLNVGSIKLKGNLFPVLEDNHLYKDDVGLCADDPLQRAPEELYQ
jgi:CRISPR-associated endonuclease/helicase Cas3